MTKQATTVLLLLLLPCLLSAQKKELSQARTYIKSGKNFEQAEKLMTGLLKDTTNRDNKKIYLLWYESVRGQYLDANRRMYLKQQQDTAAFFNLIARQFTILETLDSIDMRPDKKGRVAPEYRARHAHVLHALRPNLFNAGTFHVRKSQWQQAYDMLACYLDCARQPLFESLDYAHTDNRLPEAAYWATFAASKMQDADRTLRFAQQALSDTSKAAFTLQYMAEAYKQQRNDAAYEQTLNEGFSRFPTFHYFFPRLTDFYTSRGEHEKALELANRAVVVNDSSQLFLLAQSTALLALNRFDESLKVANRLLSRNDSLSEAYFNAGSAWLNIALGLDEVNDKVKRRDTYQKARIYMEHYRRLVPTGLQKWGPALYRIYLNLNMGKEFDEIDQLLKK